MLSPLKPMSVALRVLPQTVNNELIAQAVSHLLRGQALDEQLAELNGKRLLIDISDVPVQLHFIVKRGRLCRPSYDAATGWDVRISGRLEHFWQLATRAEDPDTLFFKRLLAIEGETETGLYIKNLLDSLDYDWDAHFQALLGEKLGRRVTRTGRRLWGLLPTRRPDAHDA